MRNKATILGPIAVIAIVWLALHFISRAIFSDAAQSSVSDVRTKTEAEHSQPAQPAQPSPKLIVDYTEIFQTMAEARDQRAILQRFEYGQSVAASIRMKQINAIRDELEKIPENTPKWIATNTRLQSAINRDYAMERTDIANLDRKYKKSMVHLFTRIESAIATVSLKHGIDAPPATSPAIPANLESVSLNQVRDLLQQRSLRQPKNAPDNMTPEVLQLLDQQYQAEKLASADTSNELTQEIEGPR